MIEPVRFGGVLRMRSALFLASSLIVLSLTSCDPAFKDPHEYFKDLMGMNVGASIDNRGLRGVVEPRILLESKHLPNGNMENKYQGRRTCRMFFEFEPETRVIVSWRFEGKTSDCRIYEFPE